MARILDVVMVPMCHGHRACVAVCLAEAVKTLRIMIFFSSRCAFHFLFISWKMIKIEAENWMNCLF